MRIVTDCDLVYNSAGPEGEVMEQILRKKLEDVIVRYETLTGFLTDPAVLSNPEERTRYTRERKAIEAMAEMGKEYRELEGKIAQTEGLMRECQKDTELVELAQEELTALEKKREALEEKLRIALLSSPEDEKNVVLEIRAGTGGEEAALFAADLFRMYCHYTERKGWKYEVAGASPTEIGGLKEVILLIEGKGAYRLLRMESGVHRVQRVPVTESGGRIHTSTATVAVLPEAEEVDIKIDPKDLRIDTFCASGPGGQGVNTTYSAVRITHIPTGTVVSCQDERSQLKNKAKALRIIRSRLLEAERAKKEADITALRRRQVGTGERSEKIRTYNFPQNRVTDHRVGVTLHQLERILAGELDELIDALLSKAPIEGSRAM